MSCQRTGICQPGLVLPRNRAEWKQKGLRNGGLHTQSGSCNNGLITKASRGAKVEAADIAALWMLGSGDKGVWIFQMQWK